MSALTELDKQIVKLAEAVGSSIDEVNVRLNVLKTSDQNKVEKEAGKKLSSNDFSDTLRQKLETTESSKFRGAFLSLQALLESYPEGARPPKITEGCYADVDSVGVNIQRYIWDDSDFKWVLSNAKVTNETSESIKIKYELNPNTNCFTDNDVSKLQGIEPKATKNATDAELRSRTTHTGVQPITTITNLQTTLDSKADVTNLNLLGSAVEKKAEKVYVDSAIKTLQADIDRKENTSDLTVALAKKVDTTVYTAGLALKADKATMTTDLSKKADKTYVDAELKKKADQSELDNFVPSAYSEIFLNSFE